MTVRSSSIPSTLRRIHDPSLATFVRVAALRDFLLLPHPESAWLAPATPARTRLRHPPPARGATRQHPGDPSGRHHRAPWTAIQIS